MAQSFGARMREQRERQAISLIAISEQTKIKLSLLEALERDDVSHWPTGIFRRAFMRSYAGAIDLDPDVIVREFLEIYPDPAEAVVPLTEAGAANGHQPGPPMRVRFLMRSAMDSVSRKWVDFAGKNRPVEMPSIDRVAASSLADVDEVPDEPGLPRPLDVRAQSGPPGLPDLRTQSGPPGLLGLPDRPGPVVADLPPEFSPVYESPDPAGLLRRAARLLDAVGLVVWTWDPKESELVPALAHGYSDQHLARFPSVRPDADNATAAAFRSTQTCIVKSSDVESGAVVVPLMTPAGCVGVLAVELPQGAEQREPVRVLAASLAGQFAALIGPPQLPHAVGV